MKLGLTSIVPSGKYKGQTVMSVLNTDPKEILKLDRKLDIEDDIVIEANLLSEEIDDWYEDHKGDFGLYQEPWDRG